MCLYMSDNINTAIVVYNVCIYAYNEYAMNLQEYS